MPKREEDELTVHPEHPMVDPRDVHVHAADVSQSKQARRGALVDSTGDKHMRLNVSFNAQI